MKSLQRYNLSPAGPVPTGEHLKPDVMDCDGWPVWQPSLLFGALATSNPEWLVTWRRLEADPQVPEARRNLPTREQVLWVDLK